MTESDRPVFAKMLYALGDTFNEPVSELRAEAYFDALSDLPIGDVLDAGRLAIRAGRFFPRPVELREQIAGKVEDLAELAWVAVQREVRRVGYTGIPIWPDVATERAAMELYGGWTRLCECLPASGPELLGVRKTFIAAFTAYAHQDAREVVALPASTGEAQKQLSDIKAALVKRGLPTGAL